MRVAQSRLGALAGAISVKQTVLVKTLIAMSPLKLICLNLNYLAGAFRLWSWR